MWGFIRKEANLIHSKRYLTVTMLNVLLVYTVCWIIPRESRCFIDYYSSVAINFVIPKDKFTLANLNFIIWWGLLQSVLPQLGSATNLYIYMWRHVKFRRILLKALFGRIYKATNDTLGGNASKHAKSTNQPQSSVAQPPF